MSDNLRRYRAICDSIVQWFPSDMSGRQRRHLLTLAALISGIVGSRHSQLDKIAAKVPLSAKPDSRTKRFGRWTANDAITPTVFFLPVAASLLAALAHRPLVLLLDGSTVGRGCIAKSAIQRNVAILGYHYALLRYSLEAKSNVPRLLMIDTIRQDDLSSELYERILKKFKDLDYTYSDTFQLLLVLRDSVDFLAEDEILQLVGGTHLLHI